MPTYCYSCPQCGTFDHTQSIHDESITSCPKCSSTVQKVFVAAGLQFKGSGFYSTDNKGK